MLVRNIYDELVLWKNRKHHPLIISGLRQVGKTYIVKEFGKNNYENVVYIDFRTNKSIHKAFDGDFNVDEMIMSISANQRDAIFIEQKTLIIFDEIQDCPNARSSLKYWDLDGRFDVLATGSFLSVKGFRKPYERGIPVGFEEHLTMYPLSFEEFLINNGIKKDIFEYLENCFKDLTIVSEVVHNSIRNLYLQYLIVGGMPEAVNVFLQTHDFNQTRNVQKNIILSIKDDFGRYIDSKGNEKINVTLKLRAEACLDSLVSQLSKDYKKFQYSLVNVKGHSTEKAEGLQYLVDTGLVVKANNVNEISNPLQAVIKPNEFKVFMSDIGLLCCMLDDSVVEKVLSGTLSSYKGAMAENMIASNLTKQNIDLFYYRASSGSPELDFLINQDDQVTIIECKSTNNKPTSMKYVLDNPNKYGTHKAIKIADTNIGYGKGFITYPLYYCGFIKKDKINVDVPFVDYSKLKTKNI